MSRLLLTAFAEFEASPYRRRDQQSMCVAECIA